MSAQWLERLALDRSGGGEHVVFMAHAKHPSDGVSCCFEVLKTTLKSEGLDHGRDQRIGPMKGGAWHHG